MSMEFKCMHTDGTTITVCSGSDGLDLAEACELFESFLRGCGYSFEGEVDIIGRQDES